MKSTIVAEVPNLREITSYPALGIYLKAGLIVLFHAAGKGVVLADRQLNGGSKHEIGEYRESWATFVFEPFAGEVTLSN